MEGCVLDGRRGEEDLGTKYLSFGRAMGPGDSIRGCCNFRLFEGCAGPMGAPVRLVPESEGEAPETPNFHRLGVPTLRGNLGGGANGPNRR